MFAKPVRVRRPGVRKPHQGAGVDSQGKQVRPKLVMQFARDLLALDVLQRYRALGEPSLFLDRFPQGFGKVIHFGTDRS